MAAESTNPQTSSSAFPLWLHINLWKTFSCFVLCGAAALGSSSSSSSSPSSSSSSSSSSSTSSLTPTGATFLACWTSYCLCWLLKSSSYPDPRWAHPATRVQRTFVWGVLSCYLVAPGSMLFHGNDGCSPLALGAFVFLFSLGNFWHYISDAHKHTALSLRPGKLVTSGLFAHSRNPNYFGELLTYLCLAGLPACALKSFSPLLPLAVSLVLEWVPNMKQKDKSLQRHGQEWERWAAGAPFLLPWKSCVEAAKEVVRVSEVAAREGCRSESAEVEDESEGESPRVLTSAAVLTKQGGGGKGGRTRAAEGPSSARRKKGGIAAGGGEVGH